MTTRSMMRFVVALIVVSPVVAGTHAPIPRYEVKRASGPLTIDGKLDEASWAAAPAVTLQFLWESQTRAKQLTRARALWDAQALFVGFDADDADINAQYQQRDAIRRLGDSARAPSADQRRSRARCYRWVRRDRCATS